MFSQIELTVRLSVELYLNNQNKIQNGLKFIENIVIVYEVWL